MKNVFVFLLLMLPQFLLAQISAPLKIIPKAIESHGDYEKIYLHTDRDYYTGGGDIFFKVYLIVGLPNIFEICGWKKVIMLL